VEHKTTSTDAPTEPAPGPQCPVAHGIAFDPFDDRVTAAPWDWLSAARRDCPAFVVGELDLWYVTTYPDVARVLTSTQEFSSEGGKFKPVAELSAELRAGYPNGHPGQDSMQMKDAPAHTRIRRLVNEALTPRAVESYEPRIRQICESLVDQFADDGECDLSAQFATPLPLRVMTELIGAPHDRDQEFLDWTRDFFVFYHGTPDPPTDRQRQISQRGRRVMGWMNDHIEARRSQPTSDLISRLVHARTPEGDPALTNGEIMAVVNSFLTAGTETTAMFIPLLVRELLRSPDLVPTLRAQPELIPNAVEEGLRYWSPARSTKRRATAEVEVAGTVVPALATVHTSLMSANHDPGTFADPERFDIRRRNAKRHLAFGRGAHMCIGAGLSRLEGRVALETLVTRLPGLRAVSEGRWESRLTIPRFFDFRVAWDAAEPRTRS
jgi:cytochrome P450